jgi:hypothetical protein
MSTDETPERFRIDKWLCAARFFKTRSLAADAVECGHVHVNEARVKPPHGCAGRYTDIRIGQLHPWSRLALSNRGSATEAQKRIARPMLPAPARDCRPAQGTAAAIPLQAGRPTRLICHRKFKKET